MRCSFSFAGRLEFENHADASALPRESDIEFIVELVAELLIEILGEGVFAFCWDSLRASVAPRGKANRWLAAGAYLVFGAALGALSGYVFPHRISQSDTLSSLGVIANALVFGVLSHLYGEWRCSHDRRTTYLATFWGGLSFAFGVSGARFAMIVL